MCRSPVDHGALDAAHSKGVVAIAEAVNVTEELTNEDLVCFDLSINPANIVVTGQIGSSGADPGAASVNATLTPTGPHGGTSGCPEGFRDAEVEIYDVHEEAPAGFYVLFN